MEILFYDDGQKYSKKALAFFVELFRSIKANVNVTILTVEKESMAKTVGYVTKAQTILQKEGFKDVDGQTYLGSSPLVLKQELSAKNRATLLVKGLPDMNPIMAEVADQDIDTLTEKIIGNLKNSIFLIKNPPQHLRKVLICTDGSAEAENSIKFFINLKLKPQPQVKILNVIPNTFKFFSSYLEPMEKSTLAVFTKIKNKRTNILYAMKQILKKSGIKARIKLCTGNVVDEVIKESTKDFDLIVLGLRGRKANRKDTVGSHTKEILIRAKCSVLAVRGKI